MIVLSRKQREIREREERILAVAQEAILTDGYFGMTMARIAAASDCPTGTVYQHFASKEDVVLALALRCHDVRLEMLQRGASFAGRPRERMAGVGEAVALFARLYPDKSRIIHSAGLPLREKAGPARVEAMERAERETVGLLRSIVQDAVDRGDLDASGDQRVERITFVLASLVDGGYALVENGIPQNLLGLVNPGHELWRAYNTLADAYGWQPLLAEMDWEETLAAVRRTRFPEEAQRLYGRGCWYGDHGRHHPGRPRSAGTRRAPARAPREPS